MRREDIWPLVGLLRRRHVAASAAVLLFAALALALYQLLSGEPRPIEPPAPAAPRADARATAPPVAPPAAPAAPAAPAPVSAPAPVVAATGSAPPATSAMSARDALQRRLDALAQAYNDGDLQAAERAMWKNHAVVRANGKLMDRSELLGQWMTEWEQISDRGLTFTITEVTEEGTRVTALWQVVLTGDLRGPEGDTHEIEFRGMQRAIYERSGVDEWLVEPIEYLGYEQIIDGATVPLPPPE